MFRVYTVVSALFATVLSAMLVGAIRGAISVAPSNETSGEKVAVLRINPVYFSSWHAPGEPLFYETSTYSENVREDDIFCEVPVRPVWKSCIVTTDSVQWDLYTSRSLAKYVFDRIDYPEEANTGNFRGLAVVAFTVEENGSVTAPAIIRNPGKGTGEALLAAVSELVDEQPPFIAAQRAGAPVPYRYNFSMKFRSE